MLDATECHLKKLSGIQLVELCQDNVKFWTNIRYPPSQKYVFLQKVHRGHVPNANSLQDIREELCLGFSLNRANIH